jgi:hypothetical protein
VIQTVDELADIYELFCRRFKVPAKFDLEAVCSTKLLAVQLSRADNDDVIAFSYVLATMPWTMPGVGLEVATALALNVARRRRGSADPVVLRVLIVQASNLEVLYSEYREWFGET